MRKRRKKQHFFIGLTLKSIVCLIGIVGLMFVFAKSFGELASQAIHIMALMMLFPVGTLVAGIVGWIWAERSDC